MAQEPNRDQEPELSETSFQEQRDRGFLFSEEPSEQATEPLEHFQARTMTELNWDHPR